MGRGWPVVKWIPQTKTTEKDLARLAGLTPNYRRVRFEEIQANPPQTLTDLAGFCGLRPTGARIAKSAASIRPERAPEWQSLPGETVRELLNNHPMVEKLGYR